MSGIWPGDTRCVVMLTFDVDGVSGAINRKPDAVKLPSLMSMREFGPSVGAPRVLDLLDKYGVKGSFYIPGYVAETHKALVKDIAKRGHEVGHHGYMHEPPATLNKKEEGEVLDKSLDILQAITGQKVKGYRSPAWELSEHSLGLIASRGFTYDSSLMGNDIPYMVDAGKGKKLVEIPVHWELDDYPYFDFSPALGSVRTIAAPGDVYRAWADIFEGMYHYGRSFMLTCHPFLIGRSGRLRALEKLIGHMQSFQGVKFMRADEVADMWAKKADK
ncbi:MAG: polysaccharide deacetylase [SAR202 cluster bacterium]|nr:polysaccharide deacetylase [SAR202 cluster bacterium]